MNETPHAEPSREEREEIEAVLGALRRWLIESGALRPPRLELGEEPAGGVRPGGDLHSVVRELVALRADVRLEAKGAKAAREKLEETAAAVERGIERSEGLVEDVVEAVESGVRSALERLREELERAQESATSGAEEALIEALDALRRGRAATEDVRRRLGWRRRLLPRGLLEGLLEGYAMASRRLERTLEALGVREVLCAGERFDPHRMKAVETEVRGDLPEGHVIEVVRPGFVKGDRILRYAEVRTAVREPAGGAPAGSLQG